MCTKCEKLIQDSKDNAKRELATAGRLTDLMGSLLGVEIPAPKEYVPPTPQHARYMEELERVIVETHVAEHVLEDIVLNKACSTVFHNIPLPPTRGEGRLKMLEHVQKHLRDAADRLNIIIGIQTRWIVEAKLKAKSLGGYPTYKEPAQRHVDAPSETPSFDFDCTISKIFDEASPVTDEMYDTLLKRAKKEDEK